MFPKFSQSSLPRPILCLYLCLSLLVLAPAAAMAENRDFATVYGADQFSRGPAPDWITERPLPPVQISQEPNTMRLADTQFRWDEGGEVTYVRRVMQANNQAGVQKLGQLQLELNPAFQTMVLHSLRVLRGSAVIDKRETVKIRFLERELGLEQSMYNGSVTVSLLVDDIRVGDAIEYTYSLHGSNPVFKGAIADTAAWQIEMPVQYRRVSVHAPAARPVAYRFIGANGIAAAVKPAERTNAGVREIVFEQRDIPPFRDEGSYPPGYVPLTWLQISEYRDWREVATWASELFTVPAGTNAEYDALVQRLRKMPDVGKRAAAALAFVQSEIRYTSVSFGEDSHRPAAPVEVLERRYGDCKDKTLLLVALYRALGMDAKPVLVNAGLRSGLGDWLPSATAFDHAIVRLDVQGKTYWLDPTALQNPYNLETVGRLHEGSDALVVDPATAGLQQIPRTTPELFTVREKVELQSLDGTGVLEKVSIVTGSSAESLRTMIAQTPLDEIKKNMLNDVQYVYSEPEWIGEPKIEDDTEHNSITYTGHYRIRNYIEQFSDGILLRHRSAYIASFFGIPEASRRNAPFGITWPAAAFYSHEVLLPQGVSLTQPESVKTVAGRFFSLRQVLQWQGRTARAEYTFSTLTPSVPAADMERYIADIRRVQNEVRSAIFIDRKQAQAAVAQADAEKYRVDAERGDAQAQFQLGMQYARGAGIKQDYRESYNWMIRAANQGHAEATAFVGMLYEDGEGVPQSYQDAALWYRKAADRGVTRAQYNLGLLYYRGQGVPKNVAEALALWRKAADGGDADAQSELGRLYALGEGVKKDVKLALQWWTRAASQDSAAAQNNLGVFYARGEGVAKDPERALEWYRKAAEQNYAQAQYNLGSMYERGDGVARNEKEALDWYRKAAENGEEDAQFKVGWYYMSKEDASQEEHRQARFWLLRSAAQKVAPAEYGMGVLYEHGIGVTRDYRQARLWYARAAEQKHALAQYRLGLLEGVDEAYVWLSLAVKNGEEDAAVALEATAGTMSGQQIAAAQKRADEWAPRPDFPKLVSAKMQGSIKTVYPEAAQRAGFVGSVVVDVMIDPKGAVEDAFIAKSSGVPEIDDLARAEAKRYLFEPAQQGYVPVASQERVAVRFDPNTLTAAPASTITTQTATPTAIVLPLPK